MRTKILLLIIAFVTFGANSQNPTRFPYGVQVTGGITTANDATKVVVQSSNNVLNTISKNDLVDAIIVNTTAELTPAIGNINKLYATRDNTLIYRYNGTIYVPIGGGDVSGKEDIANKSSSFTASSTVTYANTKALVDGLATKATGTGTANGTNTGDNATNTQYSGLVTNATHSGDATGATVLTLATVNANVGSFGSASNVPQYTVNAKGLTTASANVPIQIAQSQVTSLSADLASKVTTVGTTGNLQRIVGTNQLGNSALVDNGTSVTSSLPFLSTGSITGNSFVKAATATSNILLAGGADISQAALPISTATQTALDLKANLASPALTGTPTAPTPTATTGIANKSYVDSAITTANSNVVTLTGSVQNITGGKNFNTISGSSAILNANVSGTGVSAASFSSLNNGSAAFFTAFSAGAVNRDIITINNQGVLGTGYFINMSSASGGTDSDFISARNSSGNQLFKLDKLGATTATSFINSTAPAANVLLAGGGTLAQTGLPYLPLSGGALTGALNGTSAVFTGTSGANLTLTNSLDNSNIVFNNFNAGVFPQGQIKLMDDGAFGGSFIFSTKLSGATGNALVERFRIGNTGAATFSSSVTATDGIFTNKVINNNNVNASGSNFSVYTTNKDRNIFGYEIDRNGVKFGIKLEGQIVGESGTFSSTVTASLFKPTVYTVATLPTPPSTGTGTYATVSDAVAPAYLTPVMGGGTVVTPVFYNGSNWICH